jgi:UDP-N-acetyl-D-mannosaminuronic acid dehydrogenase
MQGSRFAIIDGGKTELVVSIIGLGYIGLATACVFSSAGATVIGVDLRQDVVDSVNRGIPHFSEKSMAALLAQGVSTGRLRAVSVPEAADAFVIAVPTPVNADKKPDMSYVEAATRSIARVLRPGNLVILESTSPVGTTRKVAALIANERPDLVLNVDQDLPGGVSFAFCPERIIPGNMLEELLNNDRVVGGLSPGAAEAAANVYGIFLQGACHRTTAEMAEMIKLAENAYRDVNLAFANELWSVCREHRLDAYELIRLANRHPRVNILTPGPGVGGHCIAVDPWFIVDANPAMTPLLKAARQVNDDKPHRVVAHVRESCDRNGWRNILCLGLTYKADVDDFRESPALEVARELTRLWPGRVACADPFANALPKAASDTTLSLMEFQAGVAWADAVVCLVNHSCYRDALRACERPVIDVCGSGHSSTSEAQAQQGAGARSPLGLVQA